MKIYSDVDCTKEVKTLDFGIVLAGDTKKAEFYLYNDSTADIVELEPIIENAEVSLVTYPKELKAHSKAVITLAWAPSLTLKQGLKAKLDFKYFELYE